MRTTGSVLLVVCVIIASAVAGAASARFASFDPPTLVPAALVLVLFAVIGLQMTQTAHLEQRLDERTRQLEHSLASHSAIRKTLEVLDAEVQRMAAIDPVAGVLNRRNFLDLADAEIVRAKRYGRPLSVLVMDVDHFRRINDLHGHRTGDRVVRTMADACRYSLRDSDHLGRLSDQLFAAILPETSLVVAEDVGDRVRETVAEVELALHEGGSMSFTTCVGVATLAPGDDGFEDLFARAELALRSSKQAGRNRVSVAHNDQVA